LSRELVNEERLVAFLSDKVTRRVGHYFENLVHYYLVHHADYSDIRHSLQIRDGNRTIGELDFVYRDADARHVHLETAVKFYLYVAGQRVIGSHYIGPNARDTLERKTQRLHQHQLPLSDLEMARIRIGAGALEPITKSNWVRGMIFYRPGEPVSTGASSILAPGHPRGVWIRESELDWFGRQPASHTYRVLRKPFWLSARGDDVDSAAANQDHVVEQLQRHFRIEKHPVMIGCFSTSLSSEVCRLMVVGDSWPETID
tara:strand:+ start:17587 stop:18360 length:774 start_codon:yes stop_codon:yes gene_type:complete